MLRLIIATTMMFAFAACDGKGPNGMETTEDFASTVGDPLTGDGFDSLESRKRRRRPRRPRQDECPPGGHGSQPVPEPGTMVLFGTGIAAVGALSRRRKKRQEASQDV